MGAAFADRGKAGRRSTLTFISRIRRRAAGRTRQGRLSAPAALLVLAALAGGCGTGGSAAEPPMPDLAVDNPPVLFASVQSGIAAEQRLVIRDSASWGRFWEEFLLGGPVPFPAQPPQVDFAREMVVVVALGTRERAGYDVRITGYVRAAGVTTISVLATTPPPGCPASPVITTPAVIAAVPIAPAVEFHERREDAPCPP
jgi:hypothetical protein